MDDEDLNLTVNKFYNNFKPRKGENMNKPLRSVERYKGNSKGSSQYRKELRSKKEKNTQGIKCTPC